MKTFPIILNKIAFVHYSYDFNEHFGFVPKIFEIFIFNEQTLNSSLKVPIYLCHNAKQKIENVIIYLYMYTNVSYTLLWKLSYKTFVGRWKQKQKQQIKIKIENKSCLVMKHDMWMSLTYCLQQTFPNIFHLFFVMLLSVSKSIFKVQFFISLHFSL